MSYIPECPDCCRSPMELKSVLERNLLTSIAFHYFFQCKFCGKVKSETTRI